VALASFYENDAEDIPVEEESQPLEEHPVGPPAPDPKPQPKPKSGGVFSSRYIIISI
jgi:hypothetical protein